MNAILAGIAASVLSSAPSAAHAAQPMLTVGSVSPATTLLIAPASGQITISIDAGGALLLVNRSPSLALPLTDWRPVSVSPPDTLRGLAFLAGMSCLYAAVFREFRATRWRRRLCGTLVAVAFVMTIVALVQAAAGTTRIYGLFQPRWDWAVFGPYVNRNHFAGYMVLAIPLALAFAAEALEALRQAWHRRRVGWLALGEAVGNAAIRRSAEAMVLMVGLLASRSRGGLVAFAVSAASFPFAFRRRRQALLVIALVTLLGTAWVGLAGMVDHFERRGLRSSRMQLWGDVLRMAPPFLPLGSGLNGFGCCCCACGTSAPGCTATALGPDGAAVER